MISTKIIRQPIQLDRLSVAEIINIILIVHQSVQPQAPLLIHVGVPLACTGLLDNGKDVFRAYAQKFTQSMLAVIIQIVLAKLGVGLMMQSHVLWGMACMMLAIRTQRFLSDFLITTGGVGGVVNNVYHSVKLIGMARKLSKGG